MPSSRKSARGAHAPSIDDDSIPSLDGGWIKGSQYGVSQGSIDGSAPADSMSKQSVSQSSRDAENRRVGNDRKRGQDIPEQAVDHSTDDSRITARQIEQEIIALSATEDPGEKVDKADRERDTANDKQMETVVRQIVGTLKKSYEDDKKRFRTALQTAFRQRLVQIEEKATEQLRRKLSKARKKDKALIAEKDARLNDLLLQLSALAAEVDRQRALVHKSSEAFEQKIMESDMVSNELHDLGRALSKQAENLGNAMVDESNRPTRQEADSAQQSPQQSPRLDPRGD